MDHWCRGDAQEEVLVIKTYDSRGSVARFTPHCSFRLRRGGAEEEDERESLEVRVLCLFGAGEGKG